MSRFSLSEIQEQKQKLQIAEALSLEKAFRSNDVDAIFKAQNYLQQQTKTDDSKVKSILIDPYDMSGSLGYKDKPHNISYNLLRGMAKTHVIKSIIETRKEQVASFCYPQTDKYSTGFIIRKRISLSSSTKTKKLTKEEEQKIEKLTMFILNCGNDENMWNADTFDTFTRKVIGDSLILDQATFELPRNEKTNKLGQFLAVDAATFRLADTYVDDQNESYKYDEKEKKKGYLPSYVQIIDGRPVNDFYPWELCFGVRNPSTDIRTNGYGRSELEDMVQTVTSILNSDAYNSNFFKVGSSPKGILRYSGNVNETTLHDFRAQWMAQTSGVMNMHKIPLINADKIDFIPTHVPNKDMEFTQFQEFLIKISCALYKIDPSEIGFPMSGNAQPSALGGEGNNEAKLKYSKDKGLKPLLKQYQYWINKYIIWQLDPAYEFVFVGIEGEITAAEELDSDIKQVQYIKTLNEVREDRNLKPLDYGDIVLNPIVLQQQMQKAQQEQMNAQQEGGGQQNPFDMEDEQDPFMKSIAEELSLLLGTQNKN